MLRFFSLPAPQVFTFILRVLPIRTILQSSYWCYLAKNKSWQQASFLLPDPRPFAEFLSNKTILFKVFSPWNYLFQKASSFMQTNLILYNIDFFSSALYNLRTTLRFIDYTNNLLSNALKHVCIFNLWSATSK